MSSSRAPSHVVDSQAVPLFVSSIEPGVPERMLRGAGRRSYRPLDRAHADPSDVNAPRDRIASPESDGHRCQSRPKPPLPVYRDQPVDDPDQWPIELRGQPTLAAPQDRHTALLGPGHEEAAAFTIRKAG